MRHDASEEAAETAFLALVDSLDASTKATRRFREIAKEADESGDYQTGIEQLKQFMKRREAARTRIDVANAQEHVEITPEDVSNMMQEIRDNMNAEHFLGDGFTAKVHTLKHPGAEEGWVCAKVITDFNQYNEGRSVIEEMSFLDRLYGLEVHGVRTPMPFFAFSSMGMDGLVMEHLDAFSIQHIVEEQTTEGIKDVLPDDFDIDTFFDRIRNYLAAMHDRSIAHGDLHLGNIMIDRASGLPYIVDFGKAQDLRTQDAPSTFNRSGGEWDLEMLRRSERELRGWMDKKGLTDKK